MNLNSVWSMLTPLRIQTNFGPSLQRQSQCDIWGSMAITGYQIALALSCIQPVYSYQKASVKTLRRFFLRHIVLRYCICNVNVTLNAKPHDCSWMDQAPIPMPASPQTQAFSISISILSFYAKGGQHSAACLYCLNIERFISKKACVIPIS